MIGRAFGLLVGLLAAVVLLALAVANRHSVKLVLDPFNHEMPVIWLDLPFYAYLFAMLIAGVILFGLGLGNATSLPPLIAQVEFVKDDVTRAVALIVGMAQAAYAFAPATFGLIRAFAPKLVDAPLGAAPYVFAMAALLQVLAITAFLAGRRRPQP